MVLLTELKLIFRGALNFIFHLSQEVILNLPNEHHY